MFDIEKWQEIFESIWQHKLRTFLTAFGVFWGIFMLVILLGAGKGLANGAENSFKDDATNSIWIYPGKTSKPHKGLPPGRFIQLDNKDFDFIKNDIDKVDQISGRYNLWGEFSISRGSKSSSYSVRSVHPGHKFIENTIVTEGRFINEYDLQEKRKVAAIGKLVVNGLFEKDEDPIGEYIDIKGIRYQVIGIFEDTGSDREMRMVYLPITTVQALENNPTRIHQLMFSTEEASIAETKVMEEEIRAHFAKTQQFDPTDKNAIWIRNISEQIQKFRNVLTGINVFVFFVALGTIIAGIIGVSNIMLIIVKERTKEIGIRKALGATPFSIISMIIMESVLITSLAGYMGLLAGVGILELMRFAMNEFKIENEFFLNPEVNFTIVIIAISLLIIFGALAGLFPAVKAASISPVEAMRDD